MPQPRLIPAVLEDDINIFQKKLDAIAMVSSYIQIDFIDGTLSTGKTANLKEMLGVSQAFDKEVHMMVRRPSQHFLTLASHKVKKCILHQESYADEQSLKADILELSRLKIKSSLTCWPNVELRTAIKANYYQIMGVVPGQSGQKILRNTKTRAVNLKQQAAQSVMISLDGGVTPPVVSEMSDVVDAFVVNSFLFQGDIARQWRMLKQAL